MAIQMRYMVWLVCMKRDKVLQNHSKKPLNFIHKQPIKDMLMHNSIWVVCTITVKVLTNQLNLHVNGGSKQPCKITRKLFNIFNN